MLNLPVSVIGGIPGTVQSMNVPMSPSVVIPGAGAR